MVSYEEVFFRRWEMMWEPFGTSTRVGVAVAYAWVLLWVDVRKKVAILKLSIIAWWRHPWGVCGAVSAIEGMGREVGYCTKMAVRHQTDQ